MHSKIKINNKFNWYRAVFNLERSQMSTGKHNIIEYYATELTITHKSNLKNRPESVLVAFLPELEMLNLIYLNLRPCLLIAVIYCLGMAAGSSEEILLFNN
ncbi:hypothetical protein BpHYR1_038850 [Brachionus plicatilis]|uniref:Uncharacterized protein n=1 Tax=Brachionus plicatilis TaxID=10195 RepID=A0A3M7P4A3_BRAPC|nr:hypothetical protein BpHYR1_038850 [Brachionus plicatilis]